jgi:hypothetical protein
VEGSLARIIEAALGRTPSLPSVRTHPEFLCGTEFSSLEDEAEFFAHRGLRPEAVAIEVCLRPGELRSARTTVFGTRDEAGVKPGWSRRMVDSSDSAWSDRGVRPP